MAVCCPGCKGKRYSKGVDHKSALALTADCILVTIQISDIALKL